MNNLPRTAMELAEHFVGPFVHQNRFYFYDQHEANYYDPLLDLYVNHEEFLEISEGF